jgi:group I intron endonuclease
VGAATSTLINSFAEDKMILYLITNLIDGKRYIGQTTTSLERRWWFHKKHSNCVYLHNAIEKHGADNFSVEVLCEPPTIDILNELEAEYIKRYCTLAPNGYNLTEGGRVPRHSEMTREKMRLSHTGLKESEETRLRKSKAGKGRIFSKEHLVNMSLSRIGHKQSEETKRRRSEAMKALRATKFWSTKKLSS